MKAKTPRSRGSSGAPSKDAEVTELTQPADAEAILQAIKAQEDER